MSEDKTPLALIAELEDMVYGDASALSMLFGQLRDKLQPETYVVDQEVLDLIGRCDDDFVIEYETLRGDGWEPSLDAIKAHLAEMVELPDDLIPPNTQIVGGVETSHGQLVYRDGNCGISYRCAAEDYLPCYDSSDITISRLNLHRLKTGEIEMRTIKFEEAK